MENSSEPAIDALDYEQLEAWYLDLNSINVRLAEELTTSIASGDFNNVGRLTTHISSNNDEIKRIRERMQEYSEGHTPIMRTPEINPVLSHSEYRQIRSEDAFRRGISGTRPNVVQFSNFFINDYILRTN